MDTVVIQIGNTDDKLSQPEWASFYSQVDRLVEAVAGQVHFVGASDATRPWQNACWVAEITPDEASTLERSLEPIRVRYRQDSIAVTYGETRFLGKGD
jgi:hypothetical protein